MDSSKPIVVIGGGAAGMIAAWRAASLSEHVVLLEKNSRLGIKILISGGGKCNITHAGKMAEIGKMFRTAEARFLKHSFYSFTNLDILLHLRAQGIETYERPDGKIFPVNHKAGEVVHALRRMMEKAGVLIKLSSPVKEIIYSGDKVAGVALQNGTIETSHIVLATGGSSYIKTGTTGDGFMWAKKLGHTLVTPRPALAPIYLSPAVPTPWQGVPIRDCLLFAESGGNILSKWKGDILFTHKGISGPAALEISFDAFLAHEQGKSVSLCIDFFPDLNNDALDNHLTNEIRNSGNRNIITLIERYVPHRLAGNVLHSAGIDPCTKCHHIQKEERRSLVRTLKSWNIGTVKEIPLEYAEVTAGGVALEEIDPKSMRSRIVKGLYLCGEVIDVAGRIGGYNLQAAFSTGFLAGTSVANDWNALRSLPSKS